MLKIENITSKIKVKEEVFSPFKSRYTLEPLYRGYGNTVGNALRRSLLSSIPGCAIKGVKIDGVLNEFSTIEGVKEDVVDILLNLKSVVLKSSTYGERTMTLSAKGPKVITAADIKGDSTLEVINPIQVIATVGEGVSIEMELLIDTGEGFVLSSDVDKSSWPKGFLAIDALYSPIKNVSYYVEDTMVGRVTNYDRLVIDIETNGAVDTKYMLSYAVELLTTHFSALLDIGNRMQHLRTELEESEDVVEPESSSLPDLKIEDLDLSVRSYNCLKKAGITTLKELAKLTAKDLMNIKNFGRNSMVEVSEKLDSYGIKVN